MLHTGIPAYANRNRILARIVALFPLLLTTSGNVLCSKFSGVWEMLWIFKDAGWIRDRCTKINKSPTVSNGIRASSFEIWTANLAQSLTLGRASSSEIQTENFAKSVTLKPDIQMWTFLIWDFFYAFIWVKKKKKLLDIYKNNVFANRDKYKVSWNFYLVFIIDF